MENLCLTVSEINLFFCAMTANVIYLFLIENRFTPIYDFGYVAMNFGWVYPEDSGEYLCRATNLYGMDETRAIIKTAGKPGIIYDSQLPKGMKSIERIREMEAAWQVYVSLIL
jgi:titin